VQIAINPFLYKYLCEGMVFGAFAYVSMHELCRPPGGVVYLEWLFSRLTVRNPGKRVDLSP
jgi:hypothetical protein